MFLLEAVLESAPIEHIEQCLVEHSKPNIALYWLNLAVKQDNPDAMQRLGQCYLSGSGVLKDKNQAMTWIPKAATLGHKIAIKQMDDIYFN